MNFKIFKYNIFGYDKDGYNRQGYNKEGYDREGFNKKGYNKDGYNSLGYDANGFNREGHDKDGYDIQGYNKDGYNRKGFDRNGYDCDGYDALGYNINGFNLEGYDKNGFDKYGNAYTDNDKLFKLISTTYNEPNKHNFNRLSNELHIGTLGIKNEKLSELVHILSKNKSIIASNQYYLTPTESDFKKDDKTFDKEFKREEKHLDNVKEQIDIDIANAKKLIQEIDTETWWMDIDQKNDWKEKKSSNIEINETIYTYEKIKNRPYYARMDVKSLKGTSRVYIGEEAYNCGDDNLNISSVWSEMGRHYREKRIKEFEYNNYDFTILLRRNIDIKDGTLFDIFDEYDITSNVSQNNITDQFLLKVLEEKKGEKNITNIIRSIQLNQNTIIDFDFDKNLLVQGCAGSGKTMILLHRLANMKFNRPNMNYEKVKIITPNKNFNLFIDELSKNLHIERILKMTLAEYWNDVILRYKIQSGAKPEGPKKIITHTKTHAENVVSKEPHLETQKNIYSNEFALKLEQHINEIPEKGLKYTKTIKEEINGKAKSKDGAQKLIDKAIQKTFEDFKIDIKVSDELNLECVLYARVLGIYYYYDKNPLIDKDNLLCIDEGQDIPLLQYGLMLRVNANKVTFNVYGDINQQIPSSCNINTWDNLLKYIDAKKFTLNENYRNSEEIVLFYNKNLGLSNDSFGLKTQDVQKISENIFAWRVLLNLILGNRTAIICNDPNDIPDKMKPYCVYNDLSTERKAVVLTVKQAKGLEYDSVFVYDKNLSRNEKYIAYTRALSELYIVG